jgi:hypothetical protein
MNFLKSLFGRKKEEPSTREKISLSVLNPSNVFDARPARSELVQKAIEKYSRVNGYKRMNTLTTPIFGIYGSLYANIPSVEAAVNKIERAVSGCGWKVIDRNGYENEELTLEVFRNMSVRDVISRAVMQLLVYGNTFYTESNGKIILPPASELDLFIADPESYKLTSFFWNSSEFDSIEFKNTESKKKFLHSKLVDLDSEVFGGSKLRAALTELDFLAIDNESIQSYLREGNMNQMLIFLPREDDGLKAEIESVLRSGKDRRIRNSPAVVPGAVTPEGNAAFKIQSIKQEPPTRLDLGERKEVDGKVYDVMGIPRQLISGSDGRVFSANEFEPAMTLFAEQAVNPLARHILDDIKAFVFPRVLKTLEQDGFFEDRKFIIREDDTERVAGAGDFTISVGTMNTETPSEKRKSYLDGFSKTLFTAKEVKKQGFGYSDLELEDDDGFRILSNSVSIVKEGELKEGDGRDGLDEDIAGERTEAVEAETPANEVESSAKSLQLRNRKEIKRLLDSFGEYETSQVEKAIDSKKGDELRRLVEDKLKKQYRDTADGVLKKTDG